MVIIDHVAIWTNNLEELKDYYVRYFNGTANGKYINEVKKFESYFVSFESGTRLEIMQMPGVPDNLNDRTGKQHLGLIHLSFGMTSMVQVDMKMNELKNDGYQILRGPRKTGDGYYEFETLDPDGNRLEVSAVFKQ
jgi:lactoylglutathione lyase